MPGILELFALLEIGSGVAFLVRWHKRVLTDKINYFHTPHNKKSPFDRLARAQTGPVIARQDQLSVRVAGGITVLIRRLVMLDAFRQLMRALALPRSPLRRRLGSRKTSPRGIALPKGSQI